jgi:hypothetical protein
MGLSRQLANLAQALGGTGALGNFLKSTPGDGSAIKNAVFEASSFKLMNAASTARALLFDVSSYSADRTISWADGDVAVPAGALLSAAGLGISKAYPGTPRLLAYATQFTWTHGLGGVPKFVIYQAQCVVAENGYAVGDTVPLATNGGSNGTNRAASLSADSTTIKISASSGAFQVGSKAASPAASQVALSAGSWNLIPIAFI